MGSTACIKYFIPMCYKNGKLELQINLEVAHKVPCTCVDFELLRGLLL